MANQRKSNDQASFDADLEKKNDTTYVEEVVILPNGDESAVKTSHYTAEEEAFLATFDEAKQKKMYRKIDIRLLPMLAMLYLFAYIDR